MSNRQQDTARPGDTLSGGGLDPTAPGAREARGGGAPVEVYGSGSPDHLANLLESTAALVDREPAQTFTDDETRIAALHLSRLLVIRLDEAAAGRSTGPAQ